jgi:ferredoxin
VAYDVRHCRTLHRSKGTACVDACPVDCIRPKKSTTYDDGRPSFDEVSLLYIDPIECIDCGAWAPVCPVSAIFAVDDLPEKWKQFAEINARYVQDGRFTPAEFAKHQAAKERMAKSRSVTEPFKRSKAHSVFSSRNAWQVGSALPLTFVCIALVAPKEA